MGFKKEAVNFRRKRDILWAYHLTDVATSLSNNLSIYLLKLGQANQIALKDIPRGLQGAVISITWSVIRGKPGRPQPQEYYSKDDLSRVLEILKSRTNEGKKSTKVGPKFFYDWSKSYTGDQNYMHGISQIGEVAVLQRLPSETYDYMSNDPVLKKFLLFMLQQNKHFSSDVIGFALICKVNAKAWVINEIQTDAINKYINVRNQYYDMSKHRGKEESEVISWDQVKDMLVTNNRGEWVDKIEGNEEAKQKLMSDPQMIFQLPLSLIEMWIEKNQHIIAKLLRGDNDLRQVTEGVNFNQRIFLLG